MTKMVDVEVILQDDVLFELAMAAHKKDITLNELCRNIIQEELDKEVFRRIVERHMKEFNLE